jgi:hypothetical protein
MGDTQTREEKALEGMTRKRLVSARALGMLQGLVENGAVPVPYRDQAWEILNEAAAADKLLKEADL